MSFARKGGFGLLAGALLLGLAWPAAAELGRRIDQEATALLRPGQFIWYEETDPTSLPADDSGSLRIIVSIPEQRAYVYRDGILIGVSTVSTGKPGHSTPVGEFTILQKRTFHRSNLYSNAPMPFMQRLTWDGVALHAGHLPGYPASHGCIRLPAAFARRLFDTTSLGVNVSVVDGVVEDPRYPDGAVPALAADPELLDDESFDVVTLSTRPRDPLMIQPAEPSLRR